MKFVPMGRIEDKLFLIQVLWLALTRTKNELWSLTHEYIINPQCVKYPNM